MYIEVTNEAGHRMVVPLWKFPALVAAEVEKKKGHIAQLKADQAAAEAAKIAQEEQQRQEEIRLAESLSAPFDLTSDPGIG